VRVLVTNDDGIDSPGLHALAAAVVDAGYDVVVAAPLDDRSGASAAIGPAAAGEGIRLEPRQLRDLPGVPAYGLEAPPALIVLMAGLGGLGEQPDVVASGINPGGNTGRAVLHSGTVGAALTAATYGGSGLAVSLAAGEQAHWDTAAAFAGPALEWLTSSPPGRVLNVNVPDRPLADVKGVRWGRLARFGTVRAAVVTTGDRIDVEFRANDDALDPDSDVALVAAGYVAVTTLGTIQAGDDLDAADFLAGRIPLLSNVAPFSGVDRETGAKLERGEG
jgi:5'-nucleotidase